MNDYLNFKIKKLIEEHTGGEKFFNELDHFIRTDKSIIDEFLNLFINKTKITCRDIVVVSGQFGDVMFNNIEQGKIIKVNGGLRTGNNVKFNMSINNLKKIINLCGPKNVYFIDDSFYSGITKNKINYKLNELFNIQITQTYVIYDGSKEKQDNIISMFRYYN